MIDDLNSVALTRDLPEDGLAAGNIGTVVFRHPKGNGFEVEFVTAGPNLGVDGVAISECSPQAFLMLHVV